MDSLADLESKVDQFVSAMKHANEHLAELSSALPTATDSSTNGEAVAGPESNSNTITPRTNGNNINSANNPPATTTNDTSADPDSAPQQQGQQPHPHTPDPDRLAAFTYMKHNWLDWGEGVLRDLELYLGRWDLPALERARLVGLADRLAWYGVRGSGKG